jgi:hypothetical protein
MGYRSDVILAMKESSFKKMMEGFTDNIALELLEGCDKTIRNEWIMLNWSNVKWYEDFKDVAAVMNFINSEDCPDDDYEFHRLGEDNDDYSCLGCDGESPFHIQVHRSLSYEE